jgi:hypothetical protein
VTQAAAKCAEVVSLDQRRARKRSPDRPGPPPRKITVLPTVRPEPAPPPPARKAQPTFCHAGEACVAHPSLGSPAKLNRYNTTRVGDALYCYWCREKIARERTVDTATRRDSERAAAARHVSRPSPKTPAASAQARPPQAGPPPEGAAL